MMTFITTAAGVRMPAILYGTAWKKAETQRLVSLAIRCGFRGIDTACQPKHYDEAGVGQGVSACMHRGLPRGDLYLQSKFTSLSGHDLNRIPYDPNAAVPDQVRESFAVSLRNLHTDYLDCLLLHSPLSTMDETHEAWRAIELLVEAGGVRQAGISNCYELPQLASLYRHARVKPAVLQNRFYAATGHDREIRAFCREYGIVYQSFWTLTANRELLTHDNIRALAAGHKRSPALVLFRYLIQDGVVPLTGTQSEQHMKDDIAVFDFELTAAECKAIDTLLYH